MAKKQVGYLELEWSCPTCATRNPGTRKVCINCGNPQPDDVKFETPVQATVVAKEEPKAQELAAQVAAGPDVHCPFCGARNPAIAKTCVQCSALLDGAKQRTTGENLGALQSGPQPAVTCHVCGAKNPAAQTICTRCGAPLRRRQAQQQAGAPAPMPRPERGGVAILWIGIGAALLVALVALIWWLGLRGETLNAVAQEARWVRTIQVDALVPVQRQAWADEVPSNVQPQRCESVLRYTSPEPVAGAQEVCGAPYTVDTGTGIGEVFQDCEYQVYDQMCSYEALAWTPVDSVVAQGVGFTPAWPAVGLSPERRIGSQSERYQCVVSAGDSTFTLDLSPQEYRLCEAGTPWTLEVNSLGGVLSAAPQ